MFLSLSLSLSLSFLFLFISLSNRPAPWSMLVFRCEPILHRLRQRADDRSAEGRNQLPEVGMAEPTRPTAAHTGAENGASRSVFLSSFC
uniref:Putative secreted protein n=1 Tax=Anopheles darlingi TaxID=43151 RepID=A0A2M4DK03_ANODA